MCGAVGKCLLAEVSQAGKAVPAAGAAAAAAAAAAASNSTVSAANQSDVVARLQFCLLRALVTAVKGRICLRIYDHDRSL